MAKPTVSVILCTYNQAGFLFKSVESVLTQSFRDLELIIVNDGSTDATAAELEKFRLRDSRVVVLDNGQNLGVPRSFNRALGEAKGQYLARVDSDDAWIGATKLERQVQFLESHPECAAVGGGMVMVDPAGHELYRYLRPETDEAIRSKALVASPIANSTSVVRTHIARQVGGCSEDLLQHEDWDFWLKVGLLGKFYNLQDYLSYYTVTGRNKSMIHMRPYTLSGLKMIRRYRGQYPGFWRGYFVNTLQLAYSFLPFFVRERIYPMMFRFKKALA